MTHSVILACCVDLLYIKTSHSVKKKIQINDQTDYQLSTECQCVCVSPHRSGVADILTGTVFSRSHSDTTDSPPPTLILPGSHTHTKHTQYLYSLTRNAGNIMMPQQPASLSFMHTHITVSAGAGLIKCNWS